MTEENREVEKFVGIDKVLEHLGGVYKKHAIWYKVRRNEIPNYRPPGSNKILFKISEIESWLRESNVTA
jgi:predicted DNA-binding transcriptional regulator AlpA